MGRRLAMLTLTIGVAAWAAAGVALAALAGRRT